jgi:oligoribonuclease (3'-5' exoribonuclease)
MPAFADSDSNRIVWVDCEMTGLDPDVDTLLEIAVIITDGDLNLVTFKILLTMFEYLFMGCPEMTSRSLGRG